MTTSTALTFAIEGIGFWGNGLPDWTAARAFVADGTLPDDAPTKPSPQLLAPNERRRAPDSVALALEVGQAACLMAGRDPATLVSVFASMHGDLSITDYICETLATAPESVSPTKFHNSVHNAAAGYWTIGAGCMAATTAVSAYDCTFAQGLLEAVVQSRASNAPVLLVAYDAHSTGSIDPISHSKGLLAAALVLNAREDAQGPRMSLSLRPGAATESGGILHARFAQNAMAPMLPVLELLAAGSSDAVGGEPLELRASPLQTLLLHSSDASA
ncbi:MAG: beta-ketoacyl synthase chain length factor [Lysobacteraceae bacterium]